MTRRTLLRTALVVLVSQLATGCGSVTKENFDKIKDGMSRKEVVSILGSPTAERDKIAAFPAATQLIWKRGEKQIVLITFLNDKVMTKVADGL